MVFKLSQGGFCMDDSYMVIKEASGRWKLGVDYIRRLCAEGKIPGVRKVNNKWMIPVQTDKPGNNSMPPHSCEKSCSSNQLNTTPDYWHQIQQMPENEKQKIRSIVRGEYIMTLRPHGYSSVNLLKVNSKTFVSAFSFNRHFLYRGDYTAPPGENNYKDDECFLTEDGLSGFAITKNNWLVSLFSNQPWKGFLKMIVPMLQRATKLVCIVNENNEGLVQAYQNTLGFKIIARTVDDLEIMKEYYGKDFIESFVLNYGHPHHVFMYRPTPEKDNLKVKVFTDYFEAEAYVDREVK